MVRGLSKRTSLLVFQKKTEDRGLFDVLSGQKNTPVGPVGKNQRWCCHLPGCSGQPPTRWCTPAPRFGRDEHTRWEVLKEVDQRQRGVRGDPRGLGAKDRWLALGTGTGRETGSISFGIIWSGVSHERHVKKGLGNPPSGRQSSWPASHPWSSARLRSSAVIPSATLLLLNAVGKWVASWAMHWMAAYLEMGGTASQHQQDRENSWWNETGAQKQTDNTKLFSRK